MASSPDSDASRTLDELLFRLGQSLRRLRVSSGEHATFTYAIGAGFWQLVAIAHHGEIRVSDLATQLNLDISTVSRQLKALAHRGLIEKVADAEDARVAKVRLTPSGKQVLEELRARRHAVLERALQNWGPDRREMLLALLADLVRELDVASSCANCGSDDERTKGPQTAKDTPTS
ncbi:transcriptional regulator, MarR family [Acidimicrobium ferrooxidans DSM 10331]|uniref:Transcriptional regulator, MarR family n=1 Tax=Acidimicrobium ferrooxidans (strain DSM 10331 / JCM 15462 / NBRC 103882 / ICP) TaxID=525909 RepID=C7M1J7_ACIFD|nr:MarR family transcriptional regulator [Acidimicrobium ferrooxidans]ACU53046.1 transcriptional regulator, MarR family [Acidimicrobium ferrooxidans DSM 10331]